MSEAIPQDPAMAPPGWLLDLSRRVGDTDFIEGFRLPATGQARESAVLMLFGPHPDGADQVVLIERAARLRSHAGQAAFPGGGRDRDDSDLVATALREANEEIALESSQVQVLTSLPPLNIPVSGYDVTPVLAWWHSPGPVYVNDPGEVARVVLAPLEELLAPENRFRVRHPRGHVGPGFEVDGLLVWGFTAILLDELLRAAGLERPWDPDVWRVPPG